MLVCADQRTDQWLQARQGKLTASLAAAVLGKDPHTGPLAAWREIMGLHRKPDNKHMAWGREFEERARRYYEVETGNLVDPTGFHVHDTIDWLGASPDGLIGTDGLLEIKCPGTLPCIIPDHHRYQMRVQMAVTNRGWCDYFAWTHTGSFLERLDRNEAVEALLLEQLADWWNRYVVTGVEPPRRRPKG